MTTPIPFPDKWVCVECKGSEWICGQPCLTCRPHDRCTCDGSGYRERDACADGQCTDVIQVSERCACNPEPIEPEWFDCDYALPAALLA